MTPDEYKEANLHIAVVCQQIEELPLLGVLSAQAQAETLGPILDPALYRRKMNAFRVDQKRARILRKAQAALESLRRTYEMAEL